MVRRTRPAPVAVIGQGVIGLTAALALSASGFEVVVYSRHRVEETTSAMAGAYWWPHKISPRHRVEAWARESLQAYLRLSVDQTTGVRMQSHRRLHRVADATAYARDLIGPCEELDAAALEPACQTAFRCEVPRIDAPIFLHYLESQLIGRGVAFRSRQLGSPDELYDDHPIVVNCSGLGAIRLVGDHSVFPIRGQTVLLQPRSLPQSSTRVVDAGELFTLVLPRERDVVLGGTVQPDDWRTEPDGDETRAIMERCAEVEPGLRGSPIVASRVGLRPGRAEVRLELEHSAAGAHLIHNYGHGGAGFTVCWGCAAEVATMARQIARPPTA